MKFCKYSIYSVKGINGSRLTSSKTENMTINFFNPFLAEHTGNNFIISAISLKLKGIFILQKKLKKFLDKNNAFVHIMLPCHII